MGLTVCGLAGILGGTHESESERRRTAARMVAELRHRGPDDEGLWSDGDAGIALAHRRLAIRDLSVAGRQPMTSGSGRYVVVFNGELYNCDDLVAGLRSPPVFRGHSDTEVLLAVVDEVGVREALDCLDGIFAIGLWDRAERTLWLIRDPLGVKPLYYYVDVRRDLLVFGSELRALLVHPHLEWRVAPEAALLLAGFGYVPAPYAILERSAKVRAGEVLRFRRGQLDSPVRELFWDPTANPRGGGSAPSAAADATEAADRLESLLRDAVRRQLVSDVPVGAFLSGGVDSSTVVALMQAQAEGPVRTFTIGFSDRSLDEAPRARAVAKRLGTAHTELYVPEAQLVETVPRIAQVYSEPFADPSQIPTYLVSRLARAQVTVALSGDGGDEVFAGYARYRRALRAWRRLRLLPLPVRRLAARVLTRVPEVVYRWAEPCKNLLAGRVVGDSLADSARKVAALLEAPDDQAVFRCLSSVAFFSKPSPLVHSPEPPTPWNSRIAWTCDRSFLENMQICDILAYLPDDILLKVDVASMAFGLEVRVPLLDRRVVEFGLGLPPALRLGTDGTGKRLLRAVLARYLPPHLVRHGKQGFSPPLDRWLRTVLREWAEELLSVRRLRESAVFDARLVRDWWARFLEGQFGCSRIWPVVMFQAFVEHYEHYGSARSRAATEGSLPALAG